MDKEKEQKVLKWLSDLRKRREWGLKEWTEFNEKLIGIAERKLQRIQKVNIG